VGYTQGNTASPSYEQVCSGTTAHTEGIQLLYDPNPNPKPNPNSNPNPKSNPNPNPITNPKPNPIRHPDPNPNPNPDPNPNPNPHPTQVRPRRGHVRRAVQEAAQHH